jgi:hypothetical protein
MRDLAVARGWTRGKLAGLVLVTIASALLLYILRGASDGLYGYDGYFHIRYAQVLRTGGFSRAFPWWQETFLRDHFADKDFLYHVFLIPFTFGDLIAGGKLAAAIFGAFAIGAFHLVCLKLRVPWPAIFSLALLASSVDFLYRLDAMRPLSMAIGLALAGTCAILLRDRRWSFAIAAIYPHVHISFHLLPCVALLHDTVCGVGPEGKRSFSIARWTAGGAAAGAILSPYLPNNLYLWWVQNVRVLALAWSRIPELRLAVEFEPRNSADLLKINLGVFAALFISVFLMARGRKRASSEATTLLLISSGFLAMAMLSERFIEFLAPFALLLAAVVVRDVTSGPRAPAPIPPGVAGPDVEAGSRGPRSRWLIATAVSTVAMLLLAYNARYAWRLISTDPGQSYADASEWMGANIPAGETIFHFDWDDFPQLFYFNPQFHYLLGLDPTFMYITSPSRWQLWSDVAHDDVDDIYRPIRETFGCRWVFAIPEGEDFLAAARRDPRFFQRYADPHATVFFLADGYTFITRWRLTGWFPNPARRLFDVPLGGEPLPPGNRSGKRQASWGKEPPAESGAAPIAPAAEGPAAAGIELNWPSGFVDLDEGLKLPASVPDACGVAEETFNSIRSESATLAITTDDEYRVYLNGEEVAEFSPYGTPPPGDAGGEPATLDEYLAARAHVPEKSVTVLVKEGSNSLLVKACRAGEDFGFFLRIYRADGSAVAGSGAEPLPVAGHPLPLPSWNQKQESRRG